MMKKWCLAILISAVSIAGVSELFACGDKFLVVSRGTRYQRAPITRPPASILVYANPASELPKALSNVPVDRTLRKAGYKPTSVATAEELERALREREWDLIVADLAEGQAIRARLRDQRAVVLPVVYNASSSDLANAKTEYRILLTAPTKAEAFLETIDDAVALKEKLHSKTRR